jgi:hypothetical protein
MFRRLVACRLQCQCEQPCFVYQVSLYLLLLEERYGQPLDMGLLWYLTEQAR